MPPKSRKAGPSKVAQSGSSKKEPITLPFRFEIYNRVYEGNYTYEEFVDVATVFYYHYYNFLPKELRVARMKKMWNDKLKTTMEEGNDLDRKEDVNKAEPKSSYTVKAKRKEPKVAAPAVDNVSDSSSDYSFEIAGGSPPSPHDSPKASAAKAGGSRSKNTKASHNPSKITSSTFRQSPTSSLNPAEDAKKRNMINAHPIDKRQKLGQSFNSCLISPIKSSGGEKRVITNPKLEALSEAMDIDMSENPELARESLDDGRRNLISDEVSSINHARSLRSRQLILDLNEDREAPRLTTLIEKVVDDSSETSDSSQDQDLFGNYGLLNQAQLVSKSPIPMSLDPEESAESDDDYAELLSDSSVI